MLIALRDYLMQKKVASLQEIAWHLQQSPEMVRCGLAHWMRKGKVCRREQPAHCGTKCQRCQPEVVELYDWQ